MSKESWLQRIKNKLRSENYVSTEGMGIDFDWAFGPNLTADEWEVKLRKLEPVYLEIFRDTVENAVDQTPEQRTKSLKRMTSRGFELLGGEGAREFAQEMKRQKQLMINITSLSQENLDNLHSALSTIPNSEEE